MGQQQGLDVNEGCFVAVENGLDDVADAQDQRPQIAQPLPCASRKMRSTMVSLAMSLKRSHATLCFVVDRMHILWTDFEFTLEGHRRVGWVLPPRDDELFVRLDGPVVRDQVGAVIGDDFSRR